MGNYTVAMINHDTWKLYSCYEDGNVVSIVVHLFSGVCPGLSSSTPNFSKRRNRTAHSYFLNYKSRITNYSMPTCIGAGSLFHCLKDWNPQFLLCDYICQKGEFWEAGVGDERRARMVNPVEKKYRCSMDWTCDFKVKDQHLHH